MPSAAAATPRRGFGKVAGLLRETMFKNLCGSYGNTAEGNRGKYKEPAPAGQPLREIFRHPTAQQWPPPDDMNTNRGFQCIRGQDSVMKNGLRSVLYELKSSRQLFFPLEQSFRWLTEHLNRNRIKKLAFLFRTHATKL